MAMSSDDEYYLGLYERHTEAREGKRARRRAGGTRRRRMRRGIEDDYVGRKSRRRRVWFQQNSLRLTAVGLFCFLVVYELVALRRPLMEEPDEQKGKGSDSYTSAIARSNWKKGEGSGSTVLPSRSKQPGVPPTSNLGKAPSTTAPPKAPPDSVSTIAAKAPQAVAENVKSQRPEAGQSNAGVTDAKDHGVSGSRETTGESGVSSREISRASKRKKRKKKNKTSGKSGRDDSSRSEKSTEDSSLVDLNVAAADDDSGKNDKEATSSKNTGEGAGSSKKGGTSGRKKKRKAGDSRVSGDDAAKPKGEQGADPGANENFWQWFQESKDSEGSGASSVDCPKESKRLCLMFYKFVRKHKIRTIFDVSCSKNLSWMPVILKKIGNELWGFKYFCSEPDGEKMGNVKSSLSQFKFVEFDSNEWWKVGFSDGVQLVFAWDILPHIAYGRVWSFFVNLRKNDVKYVLVDNYPALSNDPSPKREFINLRRHPFKFPAAKDVVQNVTEPGETQKRQLLFYDTADLPDNLG